ncbi:hypothetical protein pb186bvf_005210 [Paramecium bursaria]
MTTKASKIFYIFIIYSYFKFNKIICLSNIIQRHFSNIAQNTPSLYYSNYAENKSSIFQLLDQDIIQTKVSNNIMIPFITKRVVYTTIITIKYLQQIIVSNIIFTPLLIFIDCGKLQKIRNRNIQLYTGKSRHIVYRRLNMVTLKEVNGGTVQSQKTHESSSFCEGDNFQKTNI